MWTYIVCFFKTITVNTNIATTPIIPQHNNFSQPLCTLWNNITILGRRATIRTYWQSNVYTEYSAALPTDSLGSQNKANNDSGLLELYLSSPKNFNHQRHRQPWSLHPEGLLYMVILNAHNTAHSHHIFQRSAVFFLNLFHNSTIRLMPKTLTTVLNIHSYAIQPEISILFSTTFRQTFTKRLNPI